MTSQQFNTIVKDQTARIHKMLIKKAAEYNLEEDRLGFFKRAAVFAKETPEQVLYGFVLKQILSLSDMIQTGQVYPQDLWLEKITDIQNYLFLLLGLLAEPTK